jgi:pSer/pThr/pTyr-binding forkhead associated (FHA) protein
LLGLDTPIALAPGIDLLLGRADGAVAAALAIYPGVSKRHARVRLDDAQAWVVDLGSLNGTFVDGRRLLRDRPEPVADSAELRLGASVVLQLERAA